MTPVLRLTRSVFVVGTILTAVAGLALVVIPGRTDDFWAWPIAAPPTAAFIGAGYVGASVSLGLAARERAWVTVRLIAVLALALTTISLAVTFRDLGPFEFGSADLSGVMAWTWLAVYVSLPPLALAAFLRQERAGGRHEYDAEPALAATRLALGVAGLLVGLIGVALLLNWEAAVSRWPWPLTRLTAGVVGIWLCTYALGYLWFAVRERGWRRMRIGAIALVVTILLHLFSAARLWDDFDGGASSAVYVAACLVLVAALAGAALLEEPRTRPASPPAPAAPGAAP